MQDVCDLFDRSLVEERSIRGLADLTWPAGREPSERERARGRAARGPRVRPEPLGPLRTEAVLAALREHPRFSAGSLETYAGCPVSWLVRHLHPDALDPDPDYLVRGTFAHEVLARTFMRLREETGSARLTEASLPAAQRLLGEAIEDLRGTLAISPDATRARAEVRALEVDLRRYLAHEATIASRFEPREFELAFGFDEGLGPLELAGGSVLLRGYIDRVDVDPAGREAIVRDYKTGAPGDFPVARWKPAQRLQAALYLLAVERLLGLEPVAGVYQPVRARGEKLRPRGLVLEAAEGTEFSPRDRRSREEFDAELERAEVLAVGLAGELRAGRLEPRPESCKRGGGCAFPGICRCEP